jgi:Uri superfamily endonuclease
MSSEGRRAFLEMAKTTFMELTMHSRNPIQETSTHYTTHQAEPHHPEEQGCPEQDVLYAERLGNLEVLPPLKLPTSSGTYALILGMSEFRDIAIGKDFGTLAARPGCYVYIGSAFGSGGLLSRVGRHARRDKKLKWHIDYLTAHATLKEAWFTQDEIKRECQWAKAFAEMAQATVPLEGFGSSDCMCSSHLFFFPQQPSLAAFQQWVDCFVAGHAPIHAMRLEEHGVNGECLIDTPVQL